MKRVLEHQSLEQTWRDKFLEAQDVRIFMVMLSSEIVNLVIRLELVITEKQLKNIISLETLSGFIFEDLANSVGFILSRVCVYEMYSAKENNLLQGETSKLRFDYFLKKLCELDNKNAIFKKYQPLKKNIDSLFEQTYSTFCEFLTCLATDLDLIKIHFFDGASDLTIKHISAAGDRHRSGNRVMTLVFNEGKKLLYKPRSLKVDLIFQEFIAWINSLTGMNLYQLKVINREVYGWCEFVEYKPCKDELERQQYYTELGALLALTYFLNGSDIHAENIIAHGEHPVIVDYECFFIPKWSRVDDDRIEQRPLVSNSLILGYRTQVRPDFSGIDISGISVKQAQNSPYKSMSWEKSFTDEMRFIRTDTVIKEKQNSPFLSKENFKIQSYQQQLKDGFSKIYEAILHNKNATRSALERFKNCVIRVLLRSTLDYSKTLIESFHPELLFYSEKRDRHFDYLMEKQYRIDLEACYASEKDDMLEMNIPFFWCYSDGDIIFNGQNRPLNVLVQKTGFSCVQEMLKDILSQEDLALQLKLIDNVFKASWLTEKMEQNEVSEKERHGSNEVQPFFPYHPKAKIPGEVAYELLTMLEADQSFFQEKISWPTLAVLHDRVWTATFTSNSTLFNGNIGMAVVYATAARLFKCERFKKIAKKCIQGVNGQMLPLNDRMHYGVGAYSGLGGYLYGLKTCGELLDEPGYLNLIQNVVEHLPDIVAKDESLDIIGGAAGMILCLHDAQAYINSVTLKVAVQSCVNQIFKIYPDPAQLPKADFQASGQPLLGFSHGVSGFIYALQIARLYMSDDFIVDWIQKALAYERQYYSEENNNWPDFRSHEKSAHRPSGNDRRYITAWCHGAPGIFLSRLGLKLYGYQDRYIEIEMRQAVQNLMDCGFISNNYCLCHGILGNFDILLLAAKHGYVSYEQIHNIQEEILKRVNTDGMELNFGIGPLDIPSLMIGGAGVAYGLMRIAYFNEVSSLLFIAGN